MIFFHWYVIVCISNDKIIVDIFNNFFNYFILGLYLKLFYHDWTIFKYGIAQKNCNFWKKNFFLENHL